MVKNNKLPLPISNSCRFLRSRYKLHSTDLVFLEFLEAFRYAVQPIWEHFYPIGLKGNA